MSSPSIQTSFTTGEIDPALYGRTDLAREKNGATTMRNMWVGYRGGAYSRAGTAFVGFSKQTGQPLPPRIIPFQFSITQGLALEFGNFYMRVISDGAFVTETPIVITAATQGLPAKVTVAAIGTLAVGQWVFIANVLGMTQLNGRTFVISAIVGNVISLANVFGTPINSSTYGAYISGGTAARIFTLATPYAATDLKYLKYTQSADVMTLTLINQDTFVEYQPQDLTRFSDTSWALVPVVPASSVAAPAAVFVSASAAGTTFYQYQVTAVAADGTESVASPIGASPPSVDISSTAGTVLANWDLVPGVNVYNIYKAEAGQIAPPVGALFGFVGSAYGATFTDSNILPDFSQVPPQFNDPFNGAGNAPGCASYFQERRVFGFSLNGPDTYWMSQPGAFNNFDFRIPTIDTDAITGSPWSVQVNGIQFMLNTPGGLLIFTGLSTWLLVGSGSFATNVSPISPSSQNAIPQPEIGCSATVPPIKVDYDVLFVSSLGSFYYDLPYQLYTLSEPIDITETSAHLFSGFTIKEHAWCRQPYKLLWAVRNDGVLLSLTFHKQQQVAGWGRHDTNGTWQSVCSIKEPPVDALYLCSQRTLGLGEAYIIERMDDRLWTDAESTWCVDCGFSLPLPEPFANLYPSSAAGLGSVTGGTIEAGGANYSPQTTGQVVDAPLGEGVPPGTGSGAVPTLTFTAGVLTGIAFSAPNQGGGYANPQLVLTDPTNNGSGATVDLTLNSSATFWFDLAGVIGAPGDIGAIVRAGGGVGVITKFNDPQTFVANMLVPITDIAPNTGGIPTVQPYQSWTVSAPVTQIFLPEFAGTLLVALADGVPVPPTRVSNTGFFPLPNPASQVIIGFAFQAQLQTPYLDTGAAPTVQGQRKKISDVVARLEMSAGVKVGCNQPDGPTLSPAQLAPQWTNLDDLSLPVAKAYNAPFTPLYTGDSMRIPVTAGFAKPGQVAFQQDNPQPMAVLAVISDAWEGDKPEQNSPPKQKPRQAA